MMKHQHWEFFLRLIIKTICLFFIFGLFVQGSDGQIKIHKNFGSEDGLCQSHVFSIYEDQHGYLWFGTFDGVSQWNGLTFRNFHTYDGLAGPQVLSICEGQDGLLYLGTNRGVSVYQDGQFRNLCAGTPLEKEDIRAIYQDDTNRFYFGTRERGLCVYKDSVFTFYDAEQGLTGNDVSAIIQTGEEQIYIATDSGLCRFDSTFTIVPELDGVAISCLFEGIDGVLYAGTYHSGLYMYKNDSWSVLNKETGLAGNAVSSIAQRHDSTLFIGTFRNGVSSYTDGILQCYNEENGLINNSVFTILAGRDGTVYIGTVGGVSIIKPTQIDIFNQDCGLEGSYVIALAAAESGKIFAATLDKGVGVYEDGFWLWLNKGNGLVSNDVSDIVSINDITYIGTSLGVNVYREGEFDFITRSEGLLSDEVTALAADKDGGLYIGTEGGIHHWQDGQLSVLNHTIKGDIHAILPLPRQRLFVATSEGLSIPGTEPDAFNIPAMLSSAKVYTLYKSSCDHIYAGTENGLYIFSEGKWDSLNVHSGLSNNRISAITEDERGRIYLSTLKGINILDQDKPVRILRYTDGLPSEEFNINSCCRDPKGRLWFGSIRGAIRFDPDKNVLKKMPPIIHICEMRVMDRICSRNEELSFNHNQDYHQFSYIGINLSAPHGVTYYIQLQGADKDWIRTDQTMVNYSHLDHGGYRFRVKAVNQWGLWSKEESIGFSIKPAFWEQWWFILTVTILVIGTIVIHVYFRIRSVLAVERFRTKIAADLHDSIGSGLTEISILGEVISRQIKNSNQNIENNLRRISETSRSLIDSMSDIVWLVNPKRDSLYDLILRLKDSYSELLSERGISFKTNDLRVLGRIHLPMEHRHQLYLLFKEALNNCIKHSNCKTISLQVDISNKELIMTLFDDGEGMRKNGSPGNGLANMKNRAKSIGGEFSLRSLPQGGTMVRFRGRVK
ncbi:hypothetical protein GF407_07175 [candidate division KSB1 bacterium]|nr:hypothetical protein [candidate division KSB1 bacterium]